MSTLKEKKQGSCFLRYGRIAMYLSKLQFSDCAKEGLVEFGFGNYVLKCLNEQLRGNMNFRVNM